MPHRAFLALSTIYMYNKYIYIKKRLSGSIIHHAIAPSCVLFVFQIPLLHPVICSSSTCQYNINLFSVCHSITFSVQWLFSYAIFHWEASLGRFLTDNFEDSFVRFYLVWGVSAHEIKDRPGASIWMIGLRGGKLFFSGRPCKIIY